MKTFLLKMKYFFKRNIYPVTVSFCTVLILSVITLSAYTSIRNSNSAVKQTNNTMFDEQTVNKNADDEENVIDPVSEEKQIIFDLPFDGAKISKEFADSSLLYDTTTKLWCTHQGIDFACEEGTKVKAVYDGVVTKIESSMMNGTVVYLKVGDKLTVVYKGLSSNISVKEGDMVKRGEEIGKVTSFLAEKADGIHLHLELLQEDKLVNPTQYFSFNK